MKRHLLSLLILVTISCPLALAEARFGFNPGVGLALPTGDWSEAFGSGLSLVTQFEVEINPSIGITAQGGWQRWTAKEWSRIKVYNIPVMGGLKYYLVKGMTRPYLLGKMGMCIYGEEYTGYSDSDLGLGFGGGVEIGTSPNTSFDLSATYYSVQTEDESTNFFELRAGLKLHFRMGP